MSCFLQKLCGNTPLPPPAPPAASDQMKKVRDDVARLLNHAVKQPNINIKTEFLQKIVPLLYREHKDLSSADHVALWNAYNHLSSLLSPVTADSLEVDEELNARLYGANRKNRLLQLRIDLWGLLIWMFLFVFAVFIVQGYSIMMSNNTGRLAALTSDHIKIADEESLARKASGNNKGDDNAEPLLSILGRKKTLEAHITLSAQRQCALNDRIYQYFLSNSSDVCATFVKQPPISASEKPDTYSDPLQTFQSRADAILQSGIAIQLMLNSLILPLLLGFLGAIAFLTRNTLNHLNDYTFMPSWSGRYIMRVLLGGLLGVIGPWLYASGKVDEVGLGLSLFAFLLGYSVELAFTLFDRFINYAREAIKPGGDGAKAGGRPVSVIANPPGTEAEASPVKADGTADASAVNLQQHLQEHRKRLLEIVALEPVLEVATPPDYFKFECAPKIQMARDLLQQLDAGHDNAGADMVALAKAIGGVAEYSKSITGKNHPLATVLRTAVQSFSAVPAIDGADAIDSSRAEALVITLFTGSVAAFAQGVSAYERWLAYVWAQPFAARLISGIDLSEQDALECLKLTGIFQQAFKGQTDALAKKLLDLAASAQTSDELAEHLWQTPSQLADLAGDLPTLFGSVDVFTEGWNEYRHCLVRYVLQKVDFPNDRFGNDDSVLAVTETLAIVDILRQNKTSEKDLDILCYLSLELMKQAQTSSTFDAVDLIRRSLTEGAL